MTSSARSHVETLAPILCVGEPEWYVGGRVGRTRGAAELALLPLPRTQLLIPASSRPAAAASVRRRSAFTGRTVVVLRSALATLLRLGLVQPFLRTRLVVGPDGGGHGTLLGFASETLDRDDLVFAVGVGVPRPNRKPVIQVLARDGETLAWMKVGWNPLTRRLVAAEAATLSGPDLRALPCSTPRVLASTELEDCSVSLLSPLATGSERVADPPTAVLDAIIRIGGPPRVEALAGSPYWEGLRRRVAVADPDRRSDLGREADLVEAGAGSPEMAFGSWHGDFTPWNMALGPGRLAVWDWERSAADVPVGLDALHFFFQGGRGRLGPHGALAEARRRAAPLLAGLGVDGERCDVLARVYCLELAARFSEPELAGDVEAGLLADEYLELGRLVALPGDPTCGPAPRAARSRGRSPRL